MRLRAVLLWAALLGAAHSETLPAADFALDLEELKELSPRPGTVIGAANLARYAEFLDRDFSTFIDRGWATVTVGEPLSFEPHPAYISATARHRGQVTLGAQPGALMGYVQGRPFAGELARSDAQAGRKAAWNMRYAYLGDSGKLAEMFWQMRAWKSQAVDAEMQFEARSIRFRYRHVLTPMPAIEPNPQDAWAAFYLRGVDAGSYTGTEALIFGNRDESQPLNGWVYLPPLARTQSLAAFAATDSMFGSDLLPTDFLSYSGRLVDMQWQYLGTTYMLLPMYRHDLLEPSTRKARKFDYWHVAFGGHAGCFPKVSWQLRPTIVLAGTASDAAAVVTRRVFYLDAQTYLPLLWKIYTTDDVLWKLVINAQAHPNSHIAENKDSGAPIATAFATIDLVAEHCTTLQLLTVVNAADVTPADFDSNNLQHGGGSFRHR